jgi:Cd2+/Zn2+-exporting ATPase
MGKENEIRLFLQGLGCANCANKIEDRVNKLEAVSEATLNFTTVSLVAKINAGYIKEEVISQIKDIVIALEPHVKVLSKDPKVNNSKICKGGKCDIDEGHSHEHSHEHSHGESFDTKDNIALILGVIVYILALLFQDRGAITIILFALAYMLIGGNVLLDAFKNILRGEVFDENFLMTIATIGAFVIGEYPEAVAVMLFYEIGEKLQGYAVNRSRKSISSLMDIKAEYANVINDNKEIKMLPEEVKIEDIIIIRPGERVPLDGVVIEGSGFVDTSALTGESVPRELNVGSEILAGCINTNSVLKVRTTKEFGESTVARILELVENASNKKATTEKFITKFAKVYTPIVVFLAVAISIIPTLVIKDAQFSDWFYRALVFLVVSCPCALVVSSPLGFFAGIGGASKKGVLVKGGNYLEILKDVDTVVFDKTGTLTKGVFEVTEINVQEISKDKLLQIAAIGESLSNHPIAESIVEAYGKEIDKTNIKNYEEIAGYGVKVNIQGDEVLLGNYKLMNKFNIKYNDVESIGTIVHIAINNQYKGNIVISDEIKESSKTVLSKLKSIGIKKTVMLTGDSKVVADKVAKYININEVYSELLPEDKVNKIEDIMKGRDKKSKVAFVGDGINDAPVLARADIGVAMGGIGSDAAIEAADIVLMKDDPEALVEAIKISKKTNVILWQNIVFALGVKVFVMLLSTIGIATMWEAVFADVGVTIIAILNSIRCLR